MNAIWQRRKPWCGGLFTALLVFCLLLVGYLALTNGIATNETLPRIRVNLIPFESNGFLYFLLQYPLTGWGDDFEKFQDVTRFTAFELRGLAITFGILSLVALYRLGVRLQGKKLGLCAALAFGLHAMWISSASYARFYTLNFLFIILAFHGLLNVCERGNARAWLGYTLAWLGTVSTMMLSISLLPLHIILFGYWRRVLPGVAFEGEAHSVRTCGGECLPECVQSRSAQLGVGQPVDAQRERPSWWRLVLIVALVLFIALSLSWRDPDGKLRFGYGAFGWHSVGIAARTIMANGFNSDCINPDALTWEKSLPEVVDSDRYLTIAMVAITLAVWIAALWPDARSKRLVGLARVVAIGLLLALAGYMVISARVINVMIARNFSCLIPVSCLLAALGLRRSPAIRALFLAGLVLFTPVFCKSLSMFGYADRSPILQALNEYNCTDLVLIDKDMFPSPASWFPDALAQRLLGRGYERVQGCYPFQRTAPQLLAEMMVANRPLPRYIWVYTVDEARMMTLLGYSAVRQLGRYEVRPLFGAHTYGSIFYGTGPRKVYWLRIDDVGGDNYRGWNARNLASPRMLAPFKK